MPVAVRSWNPGPPPLHGGRSRAEEADLCGRIRTGDRRAIEELVAANQGLVRAVARRQGALTPDASLDDLQQEGNIALLHAIDTFDLARGFKFSTYAINWVHQAVTRGAHKTRLIHVPEHVYAHMDALARADEVLVYATDPTRSGPAVTRDDLTREADLTTAHAAAARAARQRRRGDSRATITNRSIRPRRRVGGRLRLRFAL
jgi:RNA polymerase sigma factor (sigma-70 family)